MKKFCRTLLILFASFVVLLHYNAVIINAQTKPLTDIFFMMTI